MDARGTESATAFGNGFILKNVVIIGMGGPAPYSLVPGDFGRRSLAEAAGAAYMWRVLAQRRIGGLESSNETDGYGQSQLQRRRLGTPTPTAP